MAAGDAYLKDPTSITNNSFLELQPAGGTEIVLHTIYYAGAVELYFYDGTDTIKFDTDGAAGVRRNLNHHCSNTVWVRVKNVSGSTMMIGADGMYTK
jgi:hypothetical protein